MASSLLSSSSSMFPSEGGMLADWTIDKRPVQAAVFNTIGRTAEKLDGLLPDLVILVADYLEVQKEERGGVFGEKEWEAHFGRIPDAVTRNSIQTAVFDTVGITATKSTGLISPLVNLVVDYLVPATPALPPGIEEIWQGPCPIFSGKRMSETHIFVYIPATVNGQPLTLNSLGMLAKQYFPETASGYQFIAPSTVEKLGDTPIGNACWVLMTNESIPGSKGKYFDDQITMVSDLARIVLPTYEVPRALEAAVCILARFASSKVRLFKDTYTLCQENIGGFQFAVGDFSPAGLQIISRYSKYGGKDYIAVAAMRKFF